MAGQGPYSMEKCSILPPPPKTTPRGPKRLKTRPRRPDKLQEPPRPPPEAPVDAGLVIASTVVAAKHGPDPPDAIEKAWREKKKLRSA